MSELFLTFRRKIVQRKMIFYGTYDNAVIHLGIDVDSEGFYYL